MKIRYWILIITISILIGLRYYQMAEYRGCGYNPIKQLVPKECWCYENGYSTNDFLAPKDGGKLIGYAGFRCDDCNEFCNKIKSLGG